MSKNIDKIGSKLIEAVDKSEKALSKQILALCNQPRTSSQILQLFPARVAQNIWSILNTLCREGKLNLAANRYVTDISEREITPTMQVNAQTRVAGTWSLPYSAEAASELKGALDDLHALGDVEVTEEGITDRIFDLIGDDDLYDTLGDATESMEIDGVTADWIRADVAVNIITDGLKVFLKRYEEDPSNFSEEFAPESLNTLNQIVSTYAEGVEASTEIEAANYPEAINFEYYEGDPICFGLGTDEYTQFEKLEGDAWENYHIDMLSKNTEVYYNHEEDVYCVESRMPDRESSDNEEEEDESKYWPDGDPQTLTDEQEGLYRERQYSKDKEAGNYTTEQLDRLEELYEKLEEAASTVDVLPYSHNIVSILLRQLASEFGKEEANKAIDNFELEELGWSKKSHTREAVTDEAQEFISKKIEVLMNEGREQDQAIAIAYSMAKEEGYDVPEKTADEDEVYEVGDEVSTPEGAGTIKNVILNGGKEYTININGEDKVFKDEEIKLAMNRKADDAEERSERFIEEVQEKEDYDTYEKEQLEGTIFDLGDKVEALQVMVTEELSSEAGEGVEKIMNHFLEGTESKFLHEAVTELGLEKAQELFKNLNDYVGVMQQSQNILNKYSTSENKQADENEERSERFIEETQRKDDENEETIAEIWNRMTPGARESYLPVGTEEFSQDDWNELPSELQDQLEYDMNIYEAENKTAEDDEDFEEELDITDMSEEEGMIEEPSEEVDIEDFVNDYVDKWTNGEVSMYEVYEASKEYPEDADDIVKLFFQQVESYIADIVKEHGGEEEGML